MIADVHALLRCHGLFDRTLERDVKLEARDLEDVEARGALRRVEKRPGVTAELDNLEILVQHDTRRRVQLDHLAVGEALQAQRGTHALGGCAASGERGTPNATSSPNCAAVCFLRKILCLRSTVENSSGASVAVSEDPSTR